MEWHLLIIPQMSTCFHPPLHLPLLPLLRQQLLVHYILLVFKMPNNPLLMACCWFVGLLVDWKRGLTKEFPRLCFRIDYLLFSVLCRLSFYVFPSYILINLVSLDLLCLRSLGCMSVWLGVFLLRSAFNLPNLFNILCFLFLVCFFFFFLEKFWWLSVLRRSLADPTLNQNFSFICLQCSSTSALPTNARDFLFFFLQRKLALYSNYSNISKRNLSVFISTHNFCFLLLVFAETQDCLFFFIISRLSLGLAVRLFLSG